MKTYVLRQHSVQAHYCEQAGAHELEGLGTFTTTIDDVYLVVEYDDPVSISTHRGTLFRRKYAEIEPDPVLEPVSGPTVWDLLGDEIIE